MGGKLPPIVQGWREEHARRRGGRARLLKEKECRGISFQYPPGWDDGSGTVRHVPSGPFKGRVLWTSRHEAREIAKRHEGACGVETRYAPD